MSQSDEQCVHQCLGDCPDAYHRLVERHQQALTRYLRGWLGDEDAVAEAAQETFVRAYFALPRLKRPETFLSWLLGIANRVAKESLRADRRRREVISLDCEMADASCRGSNSPYYPITASVSELPEIYREVVLLRFYAGLSCTEISRDLNMPLGTVTKRLSRAYSLLRASLQEQHDDVEVER